MQINAADAAGRLSTDLGNTKHENLVFRVSCISIQTRKPQDETRNKHEKRRDTKQTRKIGKFICTPRVFKYYPYSLLSSLQPWAELLGGYVGCSLPKILEISITSLPKNFKIL